MFNSPTDIQPLRIFIVEDSVFVLDALRTYLEHFGHTVFTATGMAEAWATLPSARCDVLICDLKLPDGDGFELLKQLDSSVPSFAIAMSGFGSDRYRELSKAAGYRHHLKKPFHPKEILTLLEEAAREMAQ